MKKRGRPLSPLTVTDQERAELEGFLRRRRVARARGYAVEAGTMIMEAVATGDLTPDEASDHFKLLAGETRQAGYSRLVAHNFFQPYAGVIRL